MRAVRSSGPGGPDVLGVQQVPGPREPTGTQLLVAVAASSVNGTDLLLRAGRLGPARLLRSALHQGFDLSGRVVRCGPAVTAFDPGDAVMALLGHRGGAQAELVLVEQSRAARVPTTVPLEHAAALPLAGLTALQALHGRAALHARPGARVLVHGAAGGIGSYAVQLAALAGACVTAVTSGGREDHVRALGAADVIDRADLVPDRVPALARGGQRWDVVLDVPAVLRLEQVRPLLAPGGVLVSTHPLSPDVLRSLVAAPLRRGRPRATAVATSASSQDLAHLAHLVDAGRLRIPLDRSFALDDVAAAHAHAEGGGVRGKVLLTL